MADFTLRNVKGSELTFSEVDNNFLASQTNNRLNGCSIIAPPSGVWINQSFTGDNMTIVSSATNTIMLSPFFLGWDLTIDAVGFWYLSSGSLNIRILIYSSTEDGLPDTLLNESSTISTTLGSGEYNAALTQTFNANVCYWVGVHTSGSGNFRGLGEGNLKPLGVGTGLNTTAVSDHIRATGVAVGSAPTTWSFSTSQLATNGVISVGFRAV